MEKIEEIKILFEKEIKKYNEIIWDVLKKNEKISQEHELLLADVEALDTRLIRVEKILKIIDNEEDEEDDKDEDYSNKTMDNIKNLSEFRYQIITRSKARQMMNNRFNTQINQNDEKKELNFNSNINNTVISNEKCFKNNKTKNYQGYKKVVKKRTKKKGSYSNKKNKKKYDNNNLNKINTEKNKLENTFNGLNPSLIRDNINYDNENIEIMTFKNKNMDIKDSESVISTSDNYSEFSFNPQKRKKNLEDKQKIEQIPKPLNNIKDLINSEILKSFQELDLIIKSIHNYNKFDGIPSIQTIFQSSENGDSAKDFHKFCDGEPNVIVMIETDKGNRFGGFISIGFNSDNEVKKDSYAFLFSFDSMKIYKNKKKRNSIFCKESIGPCFGDKESQDLYVSDNYFKNDSYVGKANGCFLNMNSDYELNKGNCKFIVNKLEIFKILI